MKELAGNRSATEIEIGTILSLQASLKYPFASSSSYSPFVEKARACMQV